MFEITFINYFHIVRIGCDIAMIPKFKYPFRHTKYIPRFFKWKTVRQLRLYEVYIDYKDRGGLLSDTSSWPYNRGFTVSSYILKSFYRVFCSNHKLKTRVFEHFHLHSGWTGPECLEPDRRSPFPCTWREKHRYYKYHGKPKE